MDGLVSIFALAGVDFLLAMFGLGCLFGAVTKIWGIRVYGLDWREWRHNYRVPVGFSMFTRVGMFILGVVMIGLTIYKAVTGR